MIADLKPYSTMQPSGVEWLGDVPEHWELRRTKTLLRERTEKGFADEPLLAATQSKGVVRKDQYENRTVLALKDLHLLKLVRVDDFVISLRSFEGGIEYARERGIISPAYTVLFALQPETHGYLARVFKSKPYIENLSLHVTGIREGQNIDYTELARSLLPVPPLDEQAAIVRYLDHVDQRINRYIRAKQRLIELLEEQKQAIVQQAVTRGLDPNVPLKPSGVEWLGDVPEHWEVRRLKQACRRIVGGSTPSSAETSYWDGEIVWVTPGDISQTQHLRGSLRRITHAGLRSCASELVPAGSIIVTSRAPVGNVAIAETELCTNQGCKALVLDDEVVLSSFAFNGLRALTSELESLATGTTFAEISTARLGAVPLGVPPLSEQLAIVHYLDVEATAINAAITRARREIELLREYRTRLIADVVTGKLDVREAAADLPEVDPGDLEDIIEMDDAVADELDAELEEVAT